MRIVIASILAVLLLGGTVAAQSPAASPLTPAAPASPAASPLTPAPGPALTFGATNAKVCKAGTTCTWYLTVIDPLAPTATMVTQLVPGAGKALTPTTPLPANIAPGTYLVEASAWVQGAVTAGKQPKTGRVASCFAIVTVADDPAIVSVDLKVQFKKRNKGCDIAVTYTGSAPTTPGGPQPSAQPG